MKNQLPLLVTAIVLTAVVVLAAVILGSRLNCNIDSSDQSITQDIWSTSESTKPTVCDKVDPNTSEPQPSASDTISIPGYDTIKLKANTEQQSVALFNPSENQCYFMISILLPDGQEIYRSSMIAPGHMLSSIQLNRALSVGIHKNATLQYSCYSLADLQPMNGASVKFTLEVTE